MKKHGILIVVYLFLIAPSVLAQVNDDLVQERQRREQEKNRAREREIQKLARTPSVTANQRGEKSPAVTSLERDRERKRIERQKAIDEEKKRIAALRAPSFEDIAKYKEFLKQSKTGLFRLFPDFGCEAKNVVRADGDCADAVPISSAYSFRQRDYVNYDFLDIRLKDGNLITDGFLSQEIIVSLGDVPLENLSLASYGMKFLSDFKPEQKIQEAKKQFKQIAETITLDGHHYGKSVKADLNKTYAVRIIAYRNDDKKIARLSPDTLSIEEKKFWDLEDDTRIDLIIAFRIVRQDEDGNATILWKELNRRPAPRISFQKDEKLSDINTEKSF